MNAAQQMFRVGISGSYGGLNLGDEAILQSIITQLRRTLPVEITVFSRNPEDTLARHRVERAVPARRLSRSEAQAEVERLDLLIVGGGGILFDAEAKVFLREALLAHERQVPVMVYAVGAGPLRDPAAQQAVREALIPAAVVTVRELRARAVLEEAGVHREMRLTADPAFLLEPEALPEGALEREGLEPQRRYIGMSVREPGVAAPDISEEHYQGLLANAADYMVDRFDADVVLVPMEPGMKDTQQCHAVVARMLRAQRATVLKGSYTSAQMLTLMGRFDMAVGMRLHFLIFAALQGVPFVALPYASKVEGFLEEMQIEMPPLELVNAGRLLAHIDQSWDRRRSLQTRIRRSLPALQRRALESNALATRLLSARLVRAPTGI
ncbi:polysaccharide pyruvyl transferase family protein [Ectothiorhodospiraceae bacterium 2226]|nr:polysaccharide pyruvyl transferase family protein [Ectothiorhodospiraceae bacterium 2226]